MKEKIARFNTMKNKYIQTEFAFLKAVMNSQNPKPKYTPLRPHEMTNEELRKMLIVAPRKSVKSEIMKRMMAGVKFPDLQIKQYLGMKPFLVFNFHD